MFLLNLGTCFIGISPLFPGMLFATNYCVFVLPKASLKRDFSSQPISKRRQDYHNLRVGIFTASRGPSVKSLCVLSETSRGVQLRNALVIGIPIKSICM